MVEGQSQQENAVKELDAIEHHSIPRSVKSLNKLTGRVIVEGSWGSDCIKSMQSSSILGKSERINKLISHHAKGTLIHYRGYVTRYFVAFSLMHSLLSIVVRNAVVVSCVKPLTFDCL